MTSPTNIQVLDADRFMPGRVSYAIDREKFWVFLESHASRRKGKTTRPTQLAAAGLRIEIAGSGNNQVN